MDKGQDGLLLTNIPRAVYLHQTEHLDEADGFRRCCLPGCLAASGDVCVSVSKSCQHGADPATIPVDDAPVHAARCVIVRGHCHSIRESSNKNDGRKCGRLM